MRTLAAPPHRVAGPATGLVGLVVGLVVALASALSACGGGASTAGGGAGGAGTVTTITVTPTVTVTESETTWGTPPTSQVKGRRFDFGTVTGVTSSAGYQVVVLDRWTNPAVRDSRLARVGMPVGPYQGSPFENQNTRRVFRIPVRPAAVVTLHHCTAEGEPLQTRPGSVAELASLPSADRVLLLTLDRFGWMVRAENLPRCP